VELASQIGIVHLGIGAFHRAHQAVLTEDAAVAADERGWGVCGVTQRSRRVVDQLLPQDGLYAVLERGFGEPTVRVVGQVSEVLFAGEEAGPVRDHLADPDVRLVTLTVTEKGYRRTPDGGLDLADPVVVADLAGGSRSTIGQLVRGFQARMHASAGAVSVLSCDNLTDNGAALRRLVLDFCLALPSAEGHSVGAWVEENVAFPSSMVDRIVPATTDADRAEAAELLGVRDAGLVVAEPFRQWVIEDAFAAGRPAWEKAGADLVGNVAPYERLKLRMLNGTHSLLAYLGALRGHLTIAQAVHDDVLATAARALMAEDVAPTVTVPGGPDVAAYGRTVLERFANPALRHTTAQVAMDGSQKVPLRLLGTVRDRLAVGAAPTWASLAVAGWMAYVARGTDTNGRPLPLDDPLAPVLHRAVDSATDPTAVADRLLGVREVFGDDLPASDVFRDLVVAHLKELM
jgi:fructuronate reductase